MLVLLPRPLRLAPRPLLRLAPHPLFRLPPRLLCRLTCRPLCLAPRPFRSRLLRCAFNGQLAPRPLPTIPRGKRDKLASGSNPHARQGLNLCGSWANGSGVSCYDSACAVVASE